jgi:hypothetical protein
LAYFQKNYKSYKVDPMEKNNPTLVTLLASSLGDQETRVFALSGVLGPISGNLPICNWQKINE